MFRFIRSLISNIATLIFSFVLALVIWVVAVRANDPIINKSFQLDITEQGVLAAEGIVDKNDNVVRITVEGPQSQLNPLTSQDFAAYIDLSQVTFGISDVPILVDIAADNPQESIQVVFQDPGETEIEVEEVIRKDVPVIVTVQGNAARGHEAGLAVSDPATILITGAKSQVDQIADARVSVFLSDAREDAVRVRQPTYYDEDGQVAAINGLDTETNEVRVTVPVAEIEGVADKPLIVNFTGNPATGYRLLGVSVEPNSLLVTGAPTVLQNLRSISTEEIDIAGLNESLTQRVTLDLPDGVVLDEVQPVVVTVEIEPILTSDVVRVVPEVRALTEGYTATLELEEVTVFLFGPLPALESTTADDLSVTLDLLDLEPGTHVVEPIVNIAVSNIEVRSVQPEVVTVVVTDTTLIAPEEGEGSLGAAATPITNEPPSITTTPTPVPVIAPTSTPQP